MENRAAAAAAAAGLFMLLMAGPGLAAAGAPILPARTDLGASKKCCSLPA
jgi:hypothetical protein